MGLQLPIPPPHDPPEAEVKAITHGLSWLDRCLVAAAAIVFTWLLFGCSMAITPEGVAALKARCTTAGLEPMISNNPDAVYVRCRDPIDGAVYHASDVGP